MWIIDWFLSLRINCFFASFNKNSISSLKIFEPSIFLLLENLVHKKSGCSITTLIFFSETFAFFSASLMHALTALEAFFKLTTISLWIPRDFVMEVDNISESLLLLILKYYIIYYKSLYTMKL